MDPVGLEPTTKGTFLRWPLANSTHATRRSRAKRRIAALNASVIFPSGAVEAISNPSWRWTYPSSPLACCSCGS